MAKYWYELDGEWNSLELSLNELKVFKSSNQHLEIVSDNKLSKEKKANAEQKKALNECHIKRLAEYPNIGDEIDAIMKWVASEKEISFPDELKKIASKCMEVKAKHLKPQM